MDYSPEVLRRFRSPVPASGASSGAIVAEDEAEDRTLGVWVRFRLEALDATVVRVRFEVYGCPHMIAAASWVADWLEGRSLAATERLDIHRVAEELEVPVTKLGKLVRIEDAVLACTRALRAQTTEG